MNIPLIVIPAWTLNKNSYKKLIKQSSNRKVLVASLEEIMFGDPQRFNQNFLNFLDKNKLDKIDLLGHSLGGALALKFTSEYPSRVNKLYLVDAKVIGVKESIIQALSNQFQDWFIHLNKKIGVGLGMPIRVLKNPPFHFRAGLFAKDANLEDEAKQLKVPTILIWGENDKPTPLWQAQKLQKMIPGSKLIVLKNLDHNWLLHSPENFTSPP